MCLVEIAHHAHLSQTDRIMSLLAGMGMSVVVLGAVMIVLIGVIVLLRPINRR